METHSIPKKVFMTQKYEITRVVKVTLNMLSRSRMLPILKLLIDGPSLISLKSVMPLFSSYRFMGEILILRWLASISSYHYTTKVKRYANRTTY